MSSSNEFSSSAGRAVTDSVTDTSRAERYIPRVKSAGQRLAAAARDRELKQTEIARRAGVDKGLVSRLFGGKSKQVAAGIFFDICKAIGVDPFEMWWGYSKGRHEESPPAPSPTRPPRASDPPPASVKRPSGPVRG